MSQVVTTHHSPQPQPRTTTSTQHHNTRPQHQRLQQQQQQWSTTTQTRTWDTLHLESLVFFFFFSLLFSDTNYCFIIIIVCYLRNTPREQWEKAQMTPVTSFGPFLFVFIIIIIIFIYINWYLIDYIKFLYYQPHHREGERGRERCEKAQMMLIASFGPLVRFF